MDTDTLIKILMGQSYLQQPNSFMAPNGQMTPNNFDQMVIPPFGLPPDKNTYEPNDISSYRSSPWAWRENI